MAGQVYLDDNGNPIPQQAAPPSKVYLDDNGNPLAPAGQRKPSSSAPEDPGFLHGLDESFGGIWESMKQRAAQGDSISWKDRLKEGATNAVMTNPGLGLAPGLIYKVATDAYDQGKQAFSHGVKSVQAGLKGDITTANFEAGQVYPHILAGQIPFLGPVAAKAGEDIGQGKTREGLGEGGGALLQVVAPDVIEGASNVPGKAIVRGTGKVLSSAADVVNPDVTGIVSPRLAHLQRVAGKVGDVLQKVGHAPEEAPASSPFGAHTLTDQRATVTGQTEGSQTPTPRPAVEDHPTGGPSTLKPNPVLPRQTLPTQDPLPSSPTPRPSTAGANDVTTQRSTVTGKSSPSNTPVPQPAATPTGSTEGNLDSPWGRSDTGNVPRRVKQSWESDQDYNRRNLYENAKQGGREVRAAQSSETPKWESSAEFKANQAASKAYSDVMEQENSQNAWQSLKSGQSGAPAAPLKPPASSGASSLEEALQESIRQAQAKKAAVSGNGPLGGKSPTQALFENSAAGKSAVTVNTARGAISYDLSSMAGEGSEGRSVIIRPRVNGTKIPGGNLMANIKGDTARVLNVSLPEDFRGQGIGPAMYRELIDHIMQEHPEVTKMVSGTSTTEDAAGVWEKLQQEYEPLSGSQTGIRLRKTK
jgi:hypothetical protein